MEVGAAVKNIRNMNESVRPSMLALRSLKAICPDHLYEEIEGDLIQKFNRDVKNFGEKKARRRMVWNVIRFFRLGILLRSRFSMQLNQGAMYRSYFKIMIRNMLKQT